jgi:hypothetical protein
MCFLKNFKTVHTFIMCFLKILKQCIHSLCVLKKNIFVANAFISHLNTQTMHIKSFYTQQHCYVSLKTLYPGGIGSWDLSFLRRMRCPLRQGQTITCFFGKCWKNTYYIDVYTLRYKNDKKMLRMRKNLFRSVLRRSNLISFSSPQILLATKATFKTKTIHTCIWMLHGCLPADLVFPHVMFPHVIASVFWSESGPIRL